MFANVQSIGVVKQKKKKGVACVSLTNIVYE